MCGVPIDRLDNTFLTVKMTATLFIPRVAPTATLSNPTFLHHAKAFSFSSITPTNIFELRNQLHCLSIQRRGGNTPIPCLVFASSSAPKTRLYVSGLSFRTTKESLRNAFQNFGELVEVNLVMDNIANRPRGFAFLRYATEAESQNAIEGMHGKFLDGRVIFVEVAKPRSELRKSIQNNQRRF